MKTNLQADEHVRSFKAKINNEFYEEAEFLNIVELLKSNQQHLHTIVESLILTKNSELLRRVLEKNYYQFSAPENSYFMGYNLLIIAYKNHDPKSFKCLLEQGAPVSRELYQEINEGYRIGRYLDLLDSYIHAEEFLNESPKAIGLRSAYHSKLYSYLTGIYKQYCQYELQVEHKEIFDKDDLLAQEFFNLFLKEMISKFRSLKVPPAQVTEEMLRGLVSRNNLRNIYATKVSYEKARNLEIKQLISSVKKAQTSIEQSKFAKDLFPKMNIDEFKGFISSYDGGDAIILTMLYKVFDVSYRMNYATYNEHELFWRSFSYPTIITGVINIITANATDMEKFVRLQKGIKMILSPAVDLLSYSSLELKEKYKAMAKQDLTSYSVPVQFHFVCKEAGLSQKDYDKFKISFNKVESGNAEWQDCQMVLLFLMHQKDEVITNFNFIDPTINIDFLKAVHYFNGIRDDEKFQHYVPKLKEVKFENLNLKHLVKYLHFYGRSVNAFKNILNRIGEEGRGLLRSVCDTNIMAGYDNMYKLSDKPIYTQCDSLNNYIEPSSAPDSLKKSDSLLSQSSVATPKNIGTEKPGILKRLFSSSTAPSPVVSRKEEPDLPIDSAQKDRSPTPTPTAGSPTRDDLETSIMSSPKKPKPKVFVPNFAQLPPVIDFSKVSNL